MIVRDMPEVQLGDMDEMIQEGVTSFKLFMAYPGVFQVDDATIFRALRRTGDNGGFICMHAENGGVIDELVKKALLDGQDGAEVSRAHAPRRGRGRGHAAARSRCRRWPACRSTSCTCRPRTRWRR